MLNTVSLDTLCAALTYAFGVEPPKFAAAPNEQLCTAIDEAFGAKKADRVFMYNPDAIGEWVYRKYPSCSRKRLPRRILRCPSAR